MLFAMSVFVPSSMARKNSTALLPLEMEATMNNDNITNVYDIVKSCILGLAIGDALGVPYEFMPRYQAESADLTHMTENGFYHQQPAGAWSDDTAMTLAVMDSIIHTGYIDAEAMMSAFQDWYINARYTSTGITFGVGRTINFALKKHRYGNPALACGPSGFRDNGNGALMRFSPIALFCSYNKFSRDEEVCLVNNACQITHAHEISQLGCLIYTDYMKSIVSGSSKTQAYEAICSADYNSYYSKKAVCAYRRILDGELVALPRHSLNESGYIVDTLEAALWATLKETSYKDAIRDAIHLGYDTDTVAAVTGSICGILYGAESIPEVWQNELLNRDYLENLCRAFSSVIISPLPQNQIFTQSKKSLWRTLFS